MKSLRLALPALLLVLVACSVAPSGAQQKKTGAASTSTPARPASIPSSSSDEHVDAVAAVVNDDVVLQSDVEEQLNMFLLRSRIPNPDPVLRDTLRRQMLDQLINEKLIVAEAKRLGITVSDAEINREVEKAIKDTRDQMGEQAFQAQLKKESLTEEKLRARFRDQASRSLLAVRLVNKQVPQKPVSAVDAEAYFKAHPDKFPHAPPEAKLSVIQIPATPDSAADAAAKNRLLAIRKRIVGGEKFAKVAADESEDPGSARSGGDLGFFTLGSFEENLEKAAFSLPIGKLSDPIRTPYGWHLVEVMERDTAKTKAGRDSVDAEGKAVLEAHARHILIRVKLTEADAERAKKLAERVRDQAKKGTDFATLVKRYSKYEGPAGADGDLGFVSMATLQPHIRAGIDSLEIGEVSEVLANQVGFNIFKVTDRKPERAYTLEEIKDELPEAVANIQYRERYDTWVKGLRSKAHIQIKRS